jgi:putative ABC transport system permease protein
MTSFLRDLRFGFRLLRRAPGFTAVAVIALGLGIGANTSIFSVIYATYLAPLPLRDPNRLVMIWTQTPGGRSSTAPADFLEWQRQTTAFEGLTAWTGRGVNLATNERPEFVPVGMTTPSLLRMMGYGYPLTLGRDFADDETTLGRNRVVLLSHRLWRERFGANPQIAGTQVRIDGTPYTVIGVLAPGAGDRHEYQMWMPLAFAPSEVTHDNHWLTVMGRLKPGVTIEQADAEMKTIAQNLATTFPASNARKSVSVEAFRNNFVRDSVKSALWLLVGAVAFVLLIACANVANLLLARGTVRQRELAVRASLGASRVEIVRQLITESLVLALAGGVAGVVLAFILLDVIVALLPQYTLPTEADLRVSMPVLLATLAVCVVSGVLFGSAPAWQAARTDMNETLKDGGRSAVSGRHGLRRALVAIEFALALTLLAGGGMAVSSFIALANVDLGIQPERLLTFTVPVTRGRLAGDDRIAGFYRELHDRLQEIPGVTGVAMSGGLPVRDYGFQVQVSSSSQPVANLAERPGVRYKMVTPDYFKTYGVQMVQGRTFTAHDRASAQPVAVVNEAFVKRYLSNVDPLTERLSFSRPVADQLKRGDPTEWQIVGVYRNLRNAGVRDDPQPEINVPFEQSPWPQMTMAVRTTGDPVSFRSSIAAAVQAVDAELPIANVKPMEQIIGEGIAGDRFNSVLFGAFAALALLLAAVGVYGVMSFVVAQRTPEIGLRVALGAERGRVLQQMLREGMTPALVGTGIGLAGAYFVTRAMRGLVYGASATDAAMAVAIVALAMLGIAFVACLIPARRAASVDPMVALKLG